MSLVNTIGHGLHCETAAEWHSLAVDEACTLLDSGSAGLTSTEAHQRLAQHGLNSLPEAARQGLVEIVLYQLKNPLIFLLLGAAVISIALGEYKDSVFIFLVLALNSAIGAAQEARAEANTAALRTSIRASARTRRDGVVHRIDSRKLVPGDIVLLEAGDRVPADLRLLRSANLQADEASLTGESLPVDKAARGVLPDGTPLADRLNMLHVGSTVQRGRCEALVVATGRATELGRIAQALEAPASVPPLARRLDRFSRNLGVISLVLVGAIVALRLIAGAPLRETFFIAIALAVSIIPEGLPVAVTVALSIASRRMARRNVIVRQLPAVEGLGSCTVIATDKTGTLTVNQLTAKRVWLPGHGTVLVGGEGYDLSGDLALASRPLHEAAQKDFRSLGHSAVLCNDASITGDHPATALAIARELGIAESFDDVVTGHELSSLGNHDGAAQPRIARASVFARVEPTQKVQIVNGLLGVAMGRDGTDVARDAADLVLTDDNFASVVAGIEEGRAAYANIRKVIYLLISTGAAEVVLFLLSVISGLPIPLNAVQLLWLNLVTNGGQDVALAFEKREPGLLERPPRRPDEPIFDRLMIRESTVSGVYMGVVAYAFFAWVLARGWSEFEARNMLLLLMVMFENVHVFNCRSETRSVFRIPPNSNWPLMAAVIGAQAVHIGAAFVPGLRDVLQIEPITLQMWLLLVPIAGSVLLVMELDKALRSGNH